MFDPSVSLTNGDERRPLIGVAAVFIAIALAGLPYLVTGSLEVYMVVYPAVAGALAVALYSVSRPLYVGFSLWVWFLTPFVRRLVDYGLGSYTPESMIQTAPYLVGGVGVLGLWAVLTAEDGGGRKGFGLALVALLYAAGVGLAYNGPSGTAMGALEWGIPLVTAALILVDWQQYPRYRAVVLRTMTVGMGLLGVYGLYQYFVLPPWDRMWMEAAPMISLGHPYPMQVRVYGTLNAPNPFALTMVVGLLGLLASGVRGRGDAILARLAAAPAAAALALTTVRSGWGAFVVGVIAILFLAQSRNRWRALAFIVVMSAAASPLLLFDTVSEQLGDRAATFTDLENDRSYNARMDLYSEAVPYVLTNPLGVGLGSRYEVDSGIIQLLMTLGWGGTAVYLLGFAFLCLWVWRATRRSAVHDPFIPVAVGIAIAMTATLPFGNPFMGVKGVYLWGFLALALAGTRYHGARALPAPPEAPRAGAAPARVPEAVAG